MLKIAKSSYDPRIEPLIFPFFVSRVIAVPTFNLSSWIFPLFMFTSTVPKNTIVGNTILSFDVFKVKFFKVASGIDT
ncbi:hypothetical protein D3C71_1756520 [compost metagenome]